MKKLAIIIVLLLASAVCNNAVYSQECWHIYGSNLTLYPNETANIDSISHAFATCFNFYVSPTIAASSNPNRWTEADIAEFILWVMDNDSTNTTDVFPRIWDYFSDADRDSSYAGVLFWARDPDTGEIVDYQKLEIVLYHHDDLCDVSCEGQTLYWACEDYCFPDMYDGLPNRLFVSGTAKDSEFNVKAGFAHEFQHLMFSSIWDVPEYAPSTGYSSIDESLAKGCEHYVKSYLSRIPYNWNPIGKYSYDVSYDASIWRGEPCDPDRKYYVEELWIGYLLDNYDNEPSNISDDLVYNWIRHPGTGYYQHSVTMASLAEELTATQYNWLAGAEADGNERLRNLYQSYAVARFCNAPAQGENYQYCYKGDFSPVNHIGLFRDMCAWYKAGAVPVEPIDICGTCPIGYGNCNGNWNVRILPPQYTLAAESENSMRLISGIYVNHQEDLPADTSKDYIDVYTYGTDYIIFKADQYFQDGNYHEFHFSLQGDDPTPPANTQVKMWAIGYNSTEDTLQLHPEDIVFIRPVTIDEDSTSADVVATDFGRSVKSVVIVITLVETTASDGNPFGQFKYEYQYGVYSSDDDIVWQGDVYVTGDVSIASAGSLTMMPGTNVHIADQDYSQSGGDATRIELNIWGSLSIEGTDAAPVNIASWAENPEPGDWYAIRFFAASTSGSLEHAKIEHAQYGVMSPITIELTNCELTDNFYCNAYLFEESGSSNSSSVRHCIISDADDTSGDGAVGLRIWNIANTVTVDSCTFNNNNHGIWVANAKANISHSNFDNNAVDGITYSESTRWPGSLSYCNISHSDNGVRCGTTLMMTGCNISDCDVSGVYLYGDANASHLQDCHITGTLGYEHAAGIRIWDNDHTVIVDSCRVTNNKWGIWISNSSPFISSCYVEGNQLDGIFVTYYHTGHIVAHPSIYGCRIENSGSNGIFFDYRGGTVSGCVIVCSDANGILCSGSGAYPIIDHSVIAYNQSAGVRAVSGGAPILGIILLGDGQYNSLYGQSMNLYNANANITICAENCWWGQAPPDQGKFYGKHDCKPWLTSDPNPPVIFGPEESSGDPRKSESILSLALDQNYPNPFNGAGATTISYAVPDGNAWVTICIYDVAGRRIRTLTDKAQSSGHYSATWDGRDGHGAIAPSGIYFYKLTVGGKSVSKKLILMR